MNTLLNLLAQSAPASQPAAGQGSILQGPLIPLVLVIVVIWWVMSRGRSKERQRYEQMLGALKKNDRVQTAGGILVTVVEVRDNEVILKVDEASNVKMHFNRTAIKEVLRDAASSSEKS